jgi:hypothetical protein
MLIVRVRRPKIKQGRISYSWKQNVRNRFMFRNRFFFEYPGLDLTTFDEAVHWNLFLGLMIPVFQCFEQPTRIELPAAVPSKLIQFWLLHHDALDVEVTMPKAEHAGSDESQVTVGCPTRSPWQDRICKHVSEETTGPTGRALSSRRAAVLFGGGKDSTFGLGLLSELLGEENVTMLGYVSPTRSTRFHRRRIRQFRERRARNLIDPIRAVSSVDSVEVLSNFSSNFRDQAASYAPHIAIYTAPCLPVVLSKGINFLAFNYDYGQYYTHQLAGSEAVPTFCYRRSRPEFSRATSEIYNELFGTDLEIFNLSYPISDVMAFKTVVRRYPKLAPNMMTCGATIDASKRWCHDCRKCYEFALCSLNLQCADARFDYDGFFTRSKFVEKLRAHMAADPTSDWDPCLCHSSHFQSFRHMLNGLDVGFLTRSLSKPALESVLALKERYGASAFPITERYVVQAMEFVPRELREGYENIIGELFEPEPHFKEIGRGNTRVEFRFDEQIDLKLG